MVGVEYGNSKVMVT